MKKFIACLLIILSCCFVTPAPHNGIAASARENDPAVRADGAKWRIGYCESESFKTYNTTLSAIVQGLEELGWLTGAQGVKNVEAYGSQVMWNWLADNDIGSYIEFVDDAFYNMREEDYDETALLERLKSDDLDIMLVMGGAAGYLLSNSDHDTNIFVFAASNAVRSGIIDSVEDSGKDNVWAHMDEQRFVRQTKAFHDIVQFKKLGMVYEDSANARIYSAVNEVESLAAERGFEIISYHVNEPRSAGEYPQYYAEVEAAYDKLAQEVDAVYVTIASLESEKLTDLFQPFYENKIPVFSQLGNIEVEYGALLTVSVMDEINIGRFGADNITKCLLGAKPRDLEQNFQSAPQITLNASVAKEIGFKLPFELVIVLDQVY